MLNSDHEITFESHTCFQVVIFPLNGKILLFSFILFQLSNAMIISLFWKLLQLWVWVSIVLPRFVSFPAVLSFQNEHYLYFFI